MTLPFAFPDWVPWWAQLIILVLGVLLGLALLLMPFSVFGVKSRLDSIEARLDDVQEELRTLALRLPEPTRGRLYEDDLPSAARPTPRPDPRPELRPDVPPIPPVYRPTDARERLTPERGPDSPRGRAEPRLDRR